MTLVDDLLPTLYAGRGLIGEFGLYKYTVTRRVHSWSGSSLGEGAETVTSTAITEANGQPPQVVKPSDEEIALNYLASGDLVVGPITPSFNGGGYTPAELDGGSLSTGETLDYLVTGPDLPNGAVFMVKAIHADNPFGYMLHLAPVSES